MCVGIIVDTVIIVQARKATIRATRCTVAVGLAGIAIAVAIIVAIIGGAALGIFFVLTAVAVIVDSIATNFCGIGVYSTVVVVAITCAARSAIAVPVVLRRKSVLAIVATDKDGAQAEELLMIGMDAASSASNTR